MPGLKDELIITFIMWTEELNWKHLFIIPLVPAPQRGLRSVGGVQAEEEVAGATGKLLESEDRGKEVREEARPGG